MEGSRKKSGKDKIKGNDAKVIPMEGSRKKSRKDEIKGNDAKVIPSMDRFLFLV